MITARHAVHQLHPVPVSGSESCSKQSKTRLDDDQLLGPPRSV